MPLAGHRASARQVHHRSTTGAPDSPRIVCKRMYYRLVEGLGLIRPEDLAHGEAMADRLLLELPHCLMRLIDRCRDPRTVALCRFQSLAQPYIYCSQFELPTSDRS